MNAILVTGGVIPEYKHVKHLFRDSFVCVADSGLDWILNNDVAFDYVVGDMDSLSDKNLLNSIPEGKIYRHPRDKDDTDTLIGLKLLRDKGYSKTIVIGGGEGRLDHLLGIFSLFYTDLSPEVWYTGKEVIYKVRGKFSLENLCDCEVSVYPLGKVNCSINSYGLKWKLDNVNWVYRSIGISNSVVSKEAWIDAGSNELLVIVPIVGKKFE